ncbi:MAG: HAD family phosphatase [Planctomycetia bacterium]|nr:HAD family phosphatase [Planctomycetia bacterium]RLT15420.1 MAG: HAD family phosphatase [Planctomycetota bacterium]
MRPEFIFLDLGNVIVSFDRERAMHQMAAESGAEPAVIQAFLTGNDLQQRMERGQIDWSEFHDEFSRCTQTRSDPARFAHAASDMFTLRVEMLPVIAGLERARCPIGILSNTCEIHWHHLLKKKYALMPGHAAVTVLSYEVGLLKPERAMYDLAAERSGVPPETIFFCDDLESHVAGARAAGWDAELFTSAAHLIDALDQRGLNLGI